MPDTGYYSQFGEDKILAEIFEYKTGGTCVEVGANDGIADSVSLYFEELGWKCVLVEPNPDLCQRIRKNRRCLLHECAVSERVGLVTLHVAEGADRAHGVSTICDSEAALRRIEAYGFTTRAVEVEARLLDDILEESDLDGPIDFISIDVEGHELQVLQGLTLDRWRPKILIVEDNSNREDLGVRDFLRRHGYIAFKRTGVNEWYALKSQQKVLRLGARSSYLLRFFAARALLKLNRCAGLGR